VLVKAPNGVRLTLLLPIVSFVILMLLYITFHSAAEASIVMLSVVFAMTGGAILQWMLGYNFSVAVWIGYIALYGVAVQTGVVMVMYLHEALDRRLAAGGVVRRCTPGHDRRIGSPFATDVDDRLGRHGEPRANSVEHGRWRRRDEADCRTDHRRHDHVDHPCVDQHPDHLLHVEGERASAAFRADRVNFRVQRCTHVKYPAFERRNAGIVVAAATLMRVFLRILTITALALATAQTATAQNAAGLLNRLDVQRLVLADTPRAHAALAKHFIALAAVYRADADRYSALAALPGGNPNHPVATDGRERLARQAQAAIADARGARDAAAYHLILSIRGTPRGIARSPEFDGGKGAPLPTPAELYALATAARTPSAHHELAEYFLIVSRTETANAEAYARTARMARVSGARNTAVVALRYEHLATTAREAARRANLAVELHRQLAAIS